MHQQDLLVGMFHNEIDAHNYKAELELQEQQRDLKSADEPVAGSHSWKAGENTPAPRREQAPRHSLSLLQLYRFTTSDHQGSDRPRTDRPRH
jgi:hypothetical protein